MTVVPESLNESNAGVKEREKEAERDRWDI